MNGNSKVEFVEFKALVTIAKANILKLPPIVQILVILLYNLAIWLIVLLFIFGDKTLFGEMKEFALNAARLFGFLALVGLMYLPCRVSLHKDSNFALVFIMDTIALLVFIFNGLDSAQASGETFTPGMVVAAIIVLLSALVEFYTRKNE